MFTDKGNRVVSQIVETAKKEKWECPCTSSGRFFEVLKRLSNVKGFEEATHNTVCETIVKEIHKYHYLTTAD